MKLSVRFDSDKRTPLKIIEWVVSIFSMIGGAYVMSPLLSYSTAQFGAGAIAQTIAQPTGIFIFGLLMFASGALLAVGLIRNKIQWRAYGLFACVCCRVYTLLGAWLTIGFLPLTWLASLALVLISVVAYLAIRWEQKE